MNRDKYTDSGLLKITAAVWEVKDRDCERRTAEGIYQEFCNDILGVMRVGDKDLSNILNHIINYSKIPQALTSYFVDGFLYAYELLRRQLATYKLEEDIK